MWENCWIIVTWLGNIVSTSIRLLVILTVTKDRPAKSLKFSHSSYRNAFINRSFPSYPISIFMNFQTCLRCQCFRNAREILKILELRLMLLIGRETSMT